MKTIRIDEHAWQILRDVKRAIREEAAREGKSVSPTLSDAVRYLARK